MKIYIVKEVGYEWSIDIGVFKSKQSAVRCKDVFLKHHEVKTSIGKMKMFSTSSNVIITEVIVDD